MSIWRLMKSILGGNNKGVALNKPQYSFNTVEEIYSIPIPSYSSFSGVASPVNNVEYILHRKATEFKKQGNQEMAIACLRKANEIFPHSNFVWKKKDYMRVVEFLKDFGRYEEARNEEQRILEKYRQFFSESRMQNNCSDMNAVDKFLQSYSSIYYSDGSDLISTEMTGDFQNFLMSFVN